MTAPTRQPYLTDLPDAHWDILPPPIPTSTPGGRPREGDLREVIHTILYRNRTGCQGDMLSHALLPKSTVDEYVATGRRNGTWQHLRDAGRAPVRTPPAPSPEPTPSAARRESPSVQTTEPGGARGDEGGQNIKGRTRHLSVDVLGLLWVVFVSRAAMDAAMAAPPGLKPWGRATSPRLDVRWADSQDPNHALNQGIATESPGNGHLAVVRRPEGRPGVVLLPKRWGVERTCAWLGRCRRHSKDDARRTDSSAAMWRVSAIPLMLKRLNPSHVYRPFRYRVAVEDTFRRDTQLALGGRQRAAPQRSARYPIGVGVGWL
jgi:putative transposase